MELYTSAAAMALEDGCRQLAMHNAAAPELLKYLISSQKQAGLGLEQRCFPSAKLELLWQWLGDNPQARCYLVVFTQIWACSAGEQNTPPSITQAWQDA